MIIILPRWQFLLCSISKDDEDEKTTKKMWNWEWMPDHTDGGWQQCCPYDYNFFGPFVCSSWSFVNDGDIVPLDNTVASKNSST